MWQVAFSSKSVSKKVMPVWPTRDSPSTSATSPSRFAEVVELHLAADGVGAGRGLHLDALAALEPQLEVADDRAAERERPGRADRPSGAPPVGAGEDLLGREVRARARSRRACRCRRRPARRPGSRPTVRSVPGPVKRIASRASCVELLAAARAASRRGARHAATGSGSSSRTDCATASQSRSTSGSPNICCAWPSVGKAAIVQLIDPLVLSRSWTVELHPRPPAPCRRAPGRGRRAAPARARPRSDQRRRRRRAPRCAADQPRASSRRDPRRLRAR